MARRGLLIILSSPSGAGKSTMSKALRAWDPSIRFSVSATTRPARAGEVDGRDYQFQSVEAFKASVARGDMLEHAKVFDNFYGSPKAPVQAAIEAGEDVLFDVDWQGGQQIVNSALGSSVLSIFILPPSIAELQERLLNRATDSAEVIAKRMAQSRDEISHWAEYDYVLINDDVQQTRDKLIEIVTAERQRRIHQPDLFDHVRGLEAEFTEKNQ